MARSKRLRQLQKELRELREHLLPRKFDPTGTYSARVISRTIGYRVLAHAEIEAYLEDRVLEVARSALRRWKGQGRTSRTTLCLLAFAGQTMEEPPRSIEPEQPTQAKEWDERIDVAKKIDSAARTFHYVVAKNNGVKEENLLKLLLPIGIKIDDLDGVWVSTMNTFGELRGEAAHVSRSTIKTTQPPDPESEYDTVKKLIEGLKDLDAKLNDLLG